MLARSYRVMLLVLEPLDIQLFYIQTVRYLMSSSIPVLASSYSVILLVSEAGYIHTNLEVFDVFLHSCVSSFVNVILVVSDPIDIHLFYVQTLRYLMSSSIPVLARSYSVILVVSEAAESRWGLELARRKSEEGTFQSSTLEELFPLGTSRLRLSAASQRTRNLDLDRDQSTNQSVMHTRNGMVLRVFIVEELTTHHHPFTPTVPIIANRGTCMCHTGYRKSTINTFK